MCTYFVCCQFIPVYCVFARSERGFFMELSEECIFRSMYVAQQHTTVQNMWFKNRCKWCLPPMHRPFFLTNFYRGVVIISTVDRALMQQLHSKGKQIVVEGASKKSRLQALSTLEAMFFRQKSSQYKITFKLRYSMFCTRHTGLIS